MQRAIEAIQEAIEILAPTGTGDIAVTDEAKR